MISRLACLAALVALAGGCAGSGDRPGYHLGDRERDRALARANIGGVVAADLAMARQARNEGQWRALAESSATNAVIFVPHAVNAREWLEKQREPAQAAQWRPGRVVSSCDGTLAASLGNLSAADGSSHQYITIWQRQRDRTYRWVLMAPGGDETSGEASNGASNEAGASPERVDMISSTVADCATPPPATPGEAGPVAGGSGENSGRNTSRDRTLRIEGAATTAGQTGEAPGELVVSYWTGDVFEPFFRRSVPAPPAP